MKTLKPMIQALLLLLLFVGCNSKVSTQAVDFEAEIKKKDELLSKYKNAYEKDYGFAFDNNSSTQFTIRVSYSYKKGYSAEEILTIPPNQTEKIHQPFLKICNDAEPEIIHFFLVKDINNRNNDIELKIDQPYSIPSNDPTKLNTIKLIITNLQFCNSMNSADVKNNLATKAVYTVVMD